MIQKIRYYLIHLLYTQDEKSLLTKASRTAYFKWWDNSQSTTHSASNEMYEDLRFLGTVQQSFKVDID